MKDEDTNYLKPFFEKQREGIFLFVFSEPRIEVFADTIQSARKKVEGLGIVAGELILITENY